MGAIYCKSTVYGCLTGGVWGLSIVRVLYLSVLLEVSGCKTS